LKECREISAAVNHTLNSDNLADDSKQNEVAPHGGDTGSLSELGPELVDLWLLSDEANLRADLSNKG
jgi:hypothetical protein